MKLLVFGAGGAVGGRIVHEAVERNHEVVAVHRTPPKVSRAAATVVEGDVREPGELLEREEPAAVVSAVGAAPATSSSPDYAIYLDAAEALIEALRAMRDRAPRLLVVGGAGSLSAGPDLKVIDTPQFPAQFRDEALAQARALEFYRGVSDVRWTYVSPAALFEPGDRTGSYRTGRDDLLTDADGHSRITMEDYAAAMLDELEQPQAIGRRMTVAY